MAKMSKLMFENFGDHCSAIKKLGEVVICQPVVQEDTTNEESQFDEGVVLEYTQEFDHRSAMYKNNTIPLYEPQNFSPYSLLNHSSLDT